MFHFLHTFHPDPVLFSSGGITIYWYGFFIVLGIILAIITAILLSSYYNIKKDTIVDLSFWVIIFGIIGARIYHIFLEFPYYLDQPAQMIKVWEGGLAIHGALIAGLITLYLFCRQRGIIFWKMGAVLAPGTALAQAVGRWGNYFNQELFGKPTELPWGVPIDVIHRPTEYISSQFFHPTFLYESLGSILIFLLLLGVHIFIIKQKKTTSSHYFFVVIFYLILYSLLRFGTEFIRIDDTPIWFGIRFPQLISTVIVIAGIILISPPIKNRILTSNDD